jgi:hypothetical protein
MTLPTLSDAAYIWEHSVISDLPYAASLDGCHVTLNLRVCPGETGRSVVAAWVTAQLEAGRSGERFAWLSEAQYRFLCSRRN